MPIDKDQALERIGVFSGLAHKVRSQLAAQAGMQRLSKGSILFREGERAEFLYGLVEGTVTLSSGAANNETIAEFMGPGDLLLVPPALLCAPYMVSGQAASDLLVVMIPAAEFRRLAQSDISLSAAINRMLSTHWRLLLRQIVHTRAYDADTRLKNYLLDLAAHLGVRRETLSRSLTRLAQLGVHSNGNNIEIDDLSRLRAAS
jgi:CRP/FNR family transcriptional activator FtrB